MFDLKKLNKNERSLLLYLETCLVDNGGKIDNRKINDEDIKIMINWEAKHFINFGRIKFNAITKPYNSNWIEFSDLAWKLAHKERIERSKRILAKYPIEKRGN